MLKGKIGADPANAETVLLERAESSKRVVNWQTHTVKLREDIGMEPDEQPWTVGAKGKCHGVPLSWERELDLINCAWGWRLSKNWFKTSEEARKGFVVDISQGHLERPWKQGYRTLLQSTQCRVCSL